MHAWSWHELMKGMPGRAAGAAGDPRVGGVTLDSRALRPGDVFVAARGVTPASRDGHDYIPAAIAAGAAALVLERDAALPTSASLPCWCVPDARIAAARVAERFFGEPSKRVRVCGVTGTNGKTTVSFVLATLLEALGTRAAVFGTLGAGAPDAPRASGFTTPEAPVLSRELAALADEGFRDVAMEVSSHALATQRVEALHFAAAAFTNLSQDHLDFHGDMERYFSAKARLFAELLDDPQRAVLPSTTDTWAKRLRARHPGALTYGVESGAALRASAVHQGAEGQRFMLSFEGQCAPVKSTLLGQANLENLLCAAGLALALGYPFSDVAAALSCARSAPGRLERVPGSGGKRPLVLVDYAHTPDAIARVLEAMRGLSAGRVGIVFGCGGERDRTKRPLMAAAAAARADMVVLTQDNPRREDPEEILDQMERGIAGRARVDAGALVPGTFARIPDRREAIRAALFALQPGDVLLVAGKGHERTQVIGERAEPFDDVRITSALLEELP